MRFTAILPVLLAAGCGGSTAPSSEAELIDAVAELADLGRSGDFVVIEAPDSDRFVEFRIGAADRLQAEFPLRTVTIPGTKGIREFEPVKSLPEIKGRGEEHLDPEEVGRLTDVIRRNGLEPDTLYLVAKGEKGEPVSSITSLLVELGRRQPERIAAFAFEVFRDVHGLDMVEGFVISRKIRP